MKHRKFIIKPFYYQGILDNTYPWTMGFGDFEPTSRMPSFIKLNIGTLAATTYWQEDNLIEIMDIPNEKSSKMHHH